MPRPELAALSIADQPERWQALGFAVSSTGVCELGGVAIRLGGDGRGITSWSLRNLLAEGDIDGLRTTPPPQAAPDSSAHPNTAIEIDHLAIATPDFARSQHALESAGVTLSRVRHAIRPGHPEEGEPGDPNTFRQGFRRIGPAILELVEAKQAPPGPARFFGLVVTVQSMETLAELLGEHLGAPHDAVQPGRQIATLKRSAGLGMAVAFMSPEP